MKIIKKVLSSILIKINNKAWQLQRDTKAKAEIILPVLDEYEIKSVLDIGCNAGELTRIIGNTGRFAVGIDQNVDFTGVKQPLSNACIGNIRLDQEKIKALPQFDAVLLLSVHHQFIKNFGDSHAKQLVSGMADKAKKLFLIEFAALNHKYSDDDHLFIDNDEKSVLEYSKKWLNDTLANYSCNFLGTTPGDMIEPRRYLFICEKK